ncbi:MAG: extracellular solute-binding protein [Lachnospiraceae bacterium]|nr:extracellular solute-binding protein [Lachnospiraceae bacterium]
MSTIKEVARDAGVSIATVSCCLSGTRNVKPETRAKIMDSIEKLNYIPNASARNLKISDSKSIGVVLSDIDNYFHADIFKGISDHLQNKGYGIHVAFTNDSPDIECSKIEEFVSSNCSGLLVITSQPQNTAFFASRIEKYQIPTVFIERRPKHSFAGFMAFDNYQTCRFLTEQLIESGCRRIAILTGPPAFSSESQSIFGYHAAMKKYNLPVLPEWIQTTNMTKEDAFKEILNNQQFPLLDAIITTSENIALGVHAACQIKGISIPQDLQLITFGEESWKHPVSIPGAIRTTRTAFSLGTEAARALLGQIANPEQKVCDLLLEDTIIHTDLHVVAPALSCTKPVHLQQTPLRMLMADLGTTHAISLLVESFTRQTGIPVEIQCTPHDLLLRDIITDTKKTQSTYDIYMYDIPWLEYMVQNSLAADITDDLEGDTSLRAAFVPENMDNCRLDDHYYGVPFVGGSQIMFYRQDLFEQPSIQKAFKKEYGSSLRPPRTWTEFNRVAAFFTKSIHADSPTLYGTSVAGIVDEEFAPEILIRLWTKNGMLWDAYKKVCLDTPGNREPLSSLLETLNYVEFSPLQVSIDRTVSDFCSGKTAMLVTYTEYANRISSSLHNSVIGRVGYSAVPGHSPARIGWNLGLNPDTNRRSDALCFFRWLARKDTSIYMTILDGQSPTLAPYQSNELQKLYPWLTITRDSFAYCHKRNGPYNRSSLVIPPSKIEAILCSILKKILLKQASLPSAMAQGQTEMESLFKAYGYPKPLHFIL